MRGLRHVVQLATGKNQNRMSCKSNGWGVSGLFSASGVGSAVWSKRKGRWVEWFETLKPWRRSTRDRCKQKRRLDDFRIRKTQIRPFGVKIEVGLSRVGRFGRWKMFDMENNYG
jgi:hypothetical protein